MIFCPICGRFVDHLITLKATENGHMWILRVCPDCLLTKGEIIDETGRKGP